MVRRQAMQMRRQPLGGDQRFARVGRVRTLPPPVGGWNRKDSLQNMPLTDAVSMINWFPRQSDVISRPGIVEHCDTTEGTTISQLFAYDYGTTEKLIACTNGKFIDVTTATPSTLASAFSNNFWAHDVISGIVFLANGIDTVQTFNGSVIAASTFTGVTLSLLNHVHTFKSRVYFVEKDSQKMWYGDTAAVTGALTLYDFSTVTSLEGKLMFTTHLKGDGGDGGADDVFLAIFEGGDVLAYSGSDPGDPTDWSLIGRFRIGRPLGRFCYLAAEDDVYIITDRGYEALSKMVSYGDTYSESQLLSSKIQLEVSDRIAELGDDDDWRIIRYPREQMIMFLVPRNGTARTLHVMNMNTRAWCEFQGLRPQSWARLNGTVYFGQNDGTVQQFSNVFNDNGAVIRATAQQAWTSLGTPGVNKHMHLVKPFLFSRAQPALSVNLGSNYDRIPLAGFTAGTVSDDTVWDTAVWDVSQWANAEETFADWYSKNAVGEAIGMLLSIESGTFPVRWNQTTLEFTLGGYL